MATTHIGAQRGDFAATCLLPGDPLRAKYVAETFLEEARQVNGVRNMLGYTGMFQGHEVSVMGSGMGIPSISIYAKELITDFGVRRLIRIGSCGGIADSIGLREVVIGMGAGTDSGVNRSRFGGGDFAAIADFELLQEAVAAAGRLEIPVQVGNLFSADLFYHPEEQFVARLDRMGILAVEMEAAGLYGCAAEYGAAALAICTVSNSLRSGEALPPEDRETGFAEMARLALAVAAGPSGKDDERRN